MTGLERLEKEIYDTYHDKKNKEALPMVIVLTLIFCLFNGSLLSQIILWAWYYSYCKSNNDKLNNNKYNLQHRACLEEFRRKILSGEIEFSDRYEGRLH